MEINGSGKVIYITRHGHRYDWINPNWMDEYKKNHQSDPPLSMCGKQQAEALSLALSQDKNISHIFSSPFFRTLQTSHSIAEKLNIKIQVDHGLTEWILNNNSFPEFTEEYYLSITDRYTPEFKSTIPPVGSFENPSDLHRRCWKIVERVESELMNSTGNLVFVCHAASHIALARSFLRDKSFDFFPGPCCLTKFVRKDNKWILEANCDPTHLQEDLRTDTLYSAWRFPKDLQKEIEENLKVY